MTDLLGDPIQPRSLLDPMHGFAEWWEAWPRNVDQGYGRKGDKKKCVAKWLRDGLCAQSMHIKLHTEYMRKQPQWLKDSGAFIPAPLVYMNAAQWEEWTPEPERQKQPTALEKLNADYKKAVPIPKHVRDAIKMIKATI